MGDYDIGGPGGHCKEDSQAGTQIAEDKADTWGVGVWKIRLRSLLPEPRRILSISGQYVLAGRSPRKPRRGGNM
jgi:hypothetical protein